MIGTIVITGGVFYAGVSAYRTFWVDRQSTWWEDVRTNLSTTLFKRQTNKRQVSKQQTNSAPDPVIAKPEELRFLLYDETEQLLDRNIMLAAFAAGFATMGTLFFWPIQYASIPILLYMSYPAAQEAYDEVVNEQRVGRTLLETAVLALLLAQGSYLAGSLGFALYYIGRKWVYQWRKANRIAMATWPLPAVVHVQRAACLLEIPLTQLQATDLAVIRSGEVTPITGVVMQGTAWVTGPRVGCGTPMVKRVGSTIPAGYLVMVGHITLYPAKVSS